MTIFDAPDFDDHEAVVFHSDAASGLRAIVALHDLSHGRGFGGCRMYPYADEQAAVTDALRLSRGMTYKAAVAGLAIGGGKSVIIGDPKTDKSRALIAAMGRFVDSLDGRYVIAEDIGTTVADMDVIATETRYVAGDSRGGGDPSVATARGVFEGIRAAAGHCFQTDDLGGLRVAVQGLGSVGYKLCERLHGAGVKLLVADPDADRSAQAQRAFDAEIVKPDELFSAPVDIIAPCAMGAVLNDQTIPGLQARIIAGSANNQLANASHGAALHARGILYAPDYVINAGGLIDLVLEAEHRTEADVDAHIAGIRAALTTIFGRSAEEGLAPHVIADRIAEERLGR